MAIADSYPCTLACKGVPSTKEKTPTQTCRMCHLKEAPMWFALPCTASNKSDHCFLRDSLTGQKTMLHKAAIDNSNKYTCKTSCPIFPTITLSELQLIYLAPYPSFVGCPYFSMQPIRHGGQPCQQFQWHDAEHGVKRYDISIECSERSSRSSPEIHGYKHSH